MSSLILSVVEGFSTVLAKSNYYSTTHRFNVCTTEIMILLVFLCWLIHVKTMAIMMPAVVDAVAAAITKTTIKKTLNQYAISGLL